MRYVRVDVSNEHTKYVFIIEWERYAIHLNLEHLPLVQFQILVGKV